MRDSARRTSFRAVCLRTVKTTAERSRWIERHLAKVIREHAPTVAVLGFHRNEARDHPALQKIAARVLGEHGIPVVERRIEDVRELMLGRLRGGRPNHLPETLTTSFFPELRAQLHLDIEKRRYEANAWNALSLAVAELAERKPSSALALLQPGAAIPPAFHELLTRAADNFRG